MGILNSKPLTLWFLMKFDKFQRRLFPQFKVNELAQFPIPNLENKTLLSRLSNLVEIILSKRQKEESINDENKQVDELVMDLFKLSEPEKESIRHFHF